MSCTAAAAGVPATLMAARAQAGQASSTHPAAASSNELLLDALLHAGAAAALVLNPAGAACPDSDGSSSSSSHWQQEVLPVVQQLLCPDAHDAALWSPSWQCEATAHELLSAGAAPDSSSELAGRMQAVLALKDEWRLQYAASVLGQFADAGAALLPDGAARPSVLLGDAAVDAFLHAMGQLQSVLQARPQSVEQFLRQHNDSSGRRLASGVSYGLEVAVFSLKRLSSSPLLPSDLLAPLAKTAVELWLASAASQQQQQDVFSGAPADVASGLAGLLLSPDQQLRLHAAAAWVQSCSSSAAISTNGDADSSGCSGDDLHCAVFTGVAELLLQQRGCSCSQLLPAYQAVAEVASSFLQSAAAAAAGQQQQQQLSMPAQAVARVIKVIVQQLQSLQQRPQDSAPACDGVVGPDSADRILLLQLLLTHILAVAWQQQQQQQQQQGDKEAAASTSTPDSSSVQHQQVQRLWLCKQLLPQQLVQPLADSLLQTLQALAPLLQQQEQLGGAPRRQVGTTCTVLAGEGLKQAGPGGYSNYQALLSPPPVVLTWGVSSSCCSTLLGVASNGSACNSSSSSSRAVVWPHAGVWLMDPYLQGGQSGTRLLQGLPLQLTAASIDLAHVLLRYGLVQAIGKLTAAQLLRKQPQQQQQQQQQQQAQGSQGAAAAGALCGVLCQLMDVADLQPVRPMAKQVVVDVAGSSSRYKEFRSLHLLSRHAAALLQAVALPQEQQQLEPALGQPLAVASAAVAALQGSWQRQCAAAASLSQLLSVAESQAVCWAHLCSSRGDSSSGGGSWSWQGLPQVKLLLPLLLQMALHCTIPQLGLTALKLFNAALLGVVKGRTSSTRSNGGTVGASASKQSSSGGSGSTAVEQQGMSSTTAADSSAADRSKSSSIKGSATKRIPLGLDWLLPEQPEEEQQGGSGSQGLLSDFIGCCVLGWPEGRERKEAAKTLVLLHKALGAVGHSAAQSLLLQAVLRAVPAAGAAAGAGSLQLFSAASQLLKAAGEVAAQDSADAQPSSLLQAISSTAEQLFRAAGSAAAALAGHPCAVAYQQLQQLMELQPPGSSSSSSSSGCVGFWLEVSACDVALGRPHQKPSSSAVRLDSISAELKYGDKQVGWWRCNMPWCNCFALGRCYFVELNPAAILLG